MTRKLLFSLAAFFLLGTTALRAQPSDNQKKQFMDLLLAFPSGFSTIINSATKSGFGESYYTKVNLEGTKYCRLERSEETGKLEFEGMILADDETPYAKFQEAFGKWKKIIGGLDFNGAKLVPYTTDRYKDNDMYAETAVWRLDNSKNTIEAKYQSFTICLELLDLDQGGFMVKVVVRD